jgi:hypothetical protein
VSSFNAWGVNNGSSSIPSSSTANLPSSAGTKIVRLTDDNKGLVVSNGSQFVPLEGLKTFRFEDFGGLANSSTNGTRTANNTAWTNMMAAIGAPSDSNHPQARVIFSFPLPYYFSAPIHTIHIILVEGVMGSLGFNQNVLGSSGTSLFFPPTDRGFIIDFDPNAVTGYGLGSILRNIQLFHDQTLSAWQATHAYVSGNAIIPTEFHGYVEICTTGGTSGGTEPTVGSGAAQWPDNLTSPAATDGQTTTDGSMVWTAKLCPLVDIRATAFLDKVFVGNAYGDGIRVYGNTTDSIADLCSLNDCWSWNNRGAGVFLFGNDANANMINNLSVVGNATWGVLDDGFLANRYLNLHCADNGAEPWVANTSFPLNQRSSPTQPNGFEYVVTVSGTTGGTEPVWPTTIGNTVVSGGATFKCVRPWTGGPYSGSSQVYGLYTEGGQMPSHNGTSGIIFGGTIATGFDSTSSGLVIKSAQEITPFFVPKVSSDSTFDVTNIIGDRNGNLVWQEYQLNHKNNASFDDILVAYHDGFLTFTNGNNVVGLQIPFTNAADNFTGFPVGIRFNNTGASNQIRIKADSAAPVSGAWIKGDRVINVSPSELGSGGSKYVIHGWVCTVAGTPGTWLEMRTLTGN